VSNVADAQANANDFAESNREMGASAEDAGEATGFLAGRLSTTSDEQDDVSKGADDADEGFTLLRGTVVGLTGTLGSLMLRFVGVSSVVGALSGAVSTLTGYLGALSLSGILGSVTGALSTFVGWLAAGSAGALAVGAAIGLAIGLFGVWILEITGVLDWIGRLGDTLANALPGWARDGILAIIGLFAGPLAIIGGFIVGFIEGGFDRAFERAGQITDIFFGAFKRLAGGAFDWFRGALRGVGDFVGDIWHGIERMVGDVWDGIRKTVRGAISGVQRTIQSKTEQIIGDLRRGFRNLKHDVIGFFEDIGASVVGSVRTAFNSTIPGSVAVPSVTIGGGTFAGQDLPSTTIGGGTIDLPQLQSGGIVETPGIAEVHKGEAVIPAPLADRAAASGGGGGATVQVDRVQVELSGDFDPSNVDRRTLDDLADRLVDRIGAKANRKSGIR
jgi:hypothetical protein